MSLTEISVRMESCEDAHAIHALLEPYADEGIVLRRSVEDILLYIKNFRVAYKGNQLCGCVAVRDFGNNLMEVRSLVIDRNLQGQGIGRILIEFIIKQLYDLYPDGNWSLFTLTGQPGFFQRLGFQIVSKEMFPQKIWSDCSKCKKQHCCDETALLFDHTFGKED